MLKDIWNDIILLNLKDYENIGIDFYINIFLFAVAVCICISFFFIDHKRGYMCLCVKQLLRHRAESEDSAKTLTELGLYSSGAIKRALSSDTRLSKIVKRAGAREMTYEEYVQLSKKGIKKEKIDFAEARFYISPERSHEAKHVYENYKTSIVKTLLLCLLIILIYGAVAAVSSEIIKYINSFLANV